MKNVQRGVLVVVFMGVGLFLSHCGTRHPGGDLPSDPPEIINEAAGISDDLGQSSPESNPDNSADDANPTPPADSSENESIPDDTTPGEDNNDSPSESPTDEDTSGGEGSDPTDNSESESPDEKTTFPPSPNDDFGAPGGFETMEVFDTGPDQAFNVYYPAALGRDGMRHPIITWGNGTWTIPLYYADLLHHLASHGFIVVASTNMNTGSGAEMLQGVDWIIEENENPESQFYGVVQTDAIGATGHSQGGAGTVNAANDPRVICAAPIQPSPGNADGVWGPMLVLSGGLDTIVPATWVRSNVYSPAQVPTIYGELLSATHFTPMGDGGEYRWVITAWFRHYFYADPNAESVFFGDDCTLCTANDWETERKNW